MAFILIVILAGFFSLKLVNKNSSIRIYDLKKELDIESGSVIDFRIFNPEGEMATIEDFIKLYSIYAKDQEAEFYFIYGDSQNIYSYKYDKEVLGSITAGNSGLTLEIPKLQEVKNPIEKQDKIEIVLEDQRFEFELKPGENFYYVIKSKKDGEIYSLTN